MAKHMQMVTSFRTNNLDLICKGINIDYGILQVSEFHSRNNLNGEILADEILINLFDANKKTF